MDNPLQFFIINIWKVENLAKIYIKLLRNQEVIYMLFYTLFSSISAKINITSI